MSKDEFVEKHFHEIYGMVLMALTWSDREGCHLSREIARQRERVLTVLRLAFDDLVPPNRIEATKPIRGMPPGVK